MEKEFIIKTEDKKNIYAKLRGSLKKPVIVIVHGLSGHMDEALHYNASHYFEQHGYAVMRFNLYSWKKGARNMADCTLKTHGKDIDTVVKYLQNKGAKQIYTIGHSYGAPSILHADHGKFNGIVFWDGSYHSSIKNYFKTLKFIPALKGRIMDEGYSVIVGEEMVQEAMQINSQSLIQKLTVPIKIICAGESDLIQGGKAMFNAAKTDKSFSIIPKAHHNFNEDGAEEKLYSVTLKWIDNIKS